MKKRYFFNFLFLLLLVNVANFHTQRLELRTDGITFHASSSQQRQLLWGSFQGFLVLIHLCLQGFEFLIGYLQQAVCQGHLVLSSLQFDFLVQFQGTFAGFNDIRIGLAQ